MKLRFSVVIPGWMPRWFLQAAATRRWAEGWSGEVPGVGEAFRFQRSPSTMKRSNLMNGNRNPRICALVTAGVLGAAAAVQGAPGDLDLAFNPAPDSGVETSSVLPNGKIVFGGLFTNAGGALRRRIARLNEDGSLDTAYDPNAAANPFNSGQLYSCMTLADGRLFVGGGFSNFGGAARSCAARVNVNGTLDTAFNPNVNGGVISGAVQPDGKILIGGDFTAVGGVARNHIARLNADGTLDTTFNPNAVSSVYGITVQPDGKIVIGGSFVTVGGVTRNRMARLNADGTLDTAFNPNVGRTGHSVECVMQQADGKILIGGRFDSVGGVVRNQLARVNPDGSVDTSFNPNIGGSGPTVLGLGMQCDGKIIVGGYFTSVGGSPRSNVVRLNANGSLDPTFTLNTTGAASAVYQVGLQADGKVLLSGYFGSVGGADRRYFARLQNDPATQTLTAVNINRVQWLRGGSAPEAETVAFEISTNNQATWQALGAATRVAGGWQLSGLNLPRSGHLRARARHCAGRGSSSLTESVTAFALSPEIGIVDGAELTSPALTDGQAAAVDYGTTRQGTPVTRSFTVRNTGTAPLAVSGMTVPSGYTVLTALPATVGLGQALTLQVRLDANAPGVFGGTIVVNSDDADEAAFDYPVTATVVTPEIALHEGAATGPELLDGQTAALDYGRNVQGTPGEKRFTLENKGTAALLVSSVMVPDGFALTGLPAVPFTVDAGASTGFQLSLTTLTVGAHGGSVVIASDDLDEAAFDFPVTGEVFIPDPAPAVTSTATVLNRQTGLREQTVRITNDTTATVPAYNLIIRGLPPGVEVNNASSRRDDGSWVVYVRQAMNPRSVQDILLEFFSVSRGPVEIAPQISSEVVLNPADLTVAEGSLTVHRILRMEDGAMLLEFATVPGRTYQIEYSPDGVTWQKSLPSIRAASNRTQWIDRGLPRTGSHPSSQASRFYRVAEIAAP